MALQKSERTVIELKRNNKSGTTIHSINDNGTVSDCLNGTSTLMYFTLFMVLLAKSTASSA